jgi:hypothetical protein
LRARLKNGDDDGQVVEAVLKDKLRRRLQGMTTVELLVIAQQRTSEWPRELVQYVLQGRSKTITGDIVKWEEWREQD